jgi:hypothetical protein
MSSCMCIHTHTHIRINDKSKSICNTNRMLPHTQIHTHTHMHTCAYEFTHAADVCTCNTVYVWHLASPLLLRIREDFRPPWSAPACVCMCMRRSVFCMCVCICLHFCVEFSQLCIHTFLVFYVYALLRRSFQEMHTYIFWYACMHFFALLCRIFLASVWVYVHIYFCVLLSGWIWRSRHVMHTYTTHAHMHTFSLSLSLSNTLKCTRTHTHTRARTRTRTHTHTRTRTRKRANRYALV